MRFAARPSVTTMTKITSPVTERMASVRAAGSSPIPVSQLMSRAITSTLTADTQTAVATATSVKRRVIGKRRCGTGSARPSRATFRMMACSRASAVSRATKKL